MKKVIFAIAAICTMLSSCDKTTTTKEQNPTPEKDVEKTVDFILVSMPSQRNFVDQQFEFDVNGTKVTFKESDMTQITDKKEIEKLKYLKEDVEKASQIMDGKNPEEIIQYFKYTLGKLTKGQTVKSVSRKGALKSDRPSATDFNFFNGYSLTVDGDEAILTKSQVQYHKGIDNNENGNLVINSICKNFSLDYSLK